MHYKFPIKFFTVLLLFFVIALVGCGDKTDQQGEMKKDDLKTNDLSPDTISAVTPPVESEPDGEVKVTIPDVMGTWTGTFDKRATTLKITEQTDSSFSGKITINYREVINQEVKGTIHTSSMKLTMADQLHSRYKGKYNGRLSEDGKTYSGTFTMDLDGKQFSFNLIKK